MTYEYFQAHATLLSPIPCMSICLLSAALWAEALVQAHFRAPGINSFFQSKSESKGLGIS